MTKILKIDYCPYILQSKYHPNSRTNDLKRHGALLRFLFKEIGYGYADCHPLEEFGDAPLKSQLNLLKEKKFSFLTQRSAYFARLDADARNQKQSVFAQILSKNVTEKSILFPKNHFTAPAQLKKEDILARKQEGFEKFKFKFGKHISNELNYLNDNAQFFIDNNLKIRIDYNGSLRINVNKRFDNGLNAEEVLNHLTEYKDIIDFIEDPFTEMDESKNNLIKKYANDLNFAIDFLHTDHQDVFNYKIVKPARENYIKLKIDRAKMIFTSSMDHPLGQVCALYDACLANTKEYCGFMTHYLFEPSDYSDQLVIEKSHLLPSEGFGFGFNGLLQNEQWSKCF